MMGKALSEPDYIYKTWGGGTIRVYKYPRKIFKRETPTQNDQVHINLNWEIIENCSETTNKL